MVILQRLLPVRFFIAVSSFIATILCLGYGYFFITEHIGFLLLVLFFSIGLGVAFLKYFQTQEFEDFVATMQKANPNICIKK